MVFLNEVKEVSSVLDEMGSCPRIEDSGEAMWRYMAQEFREFPNVHYVENSSHMDFILVAYISMTLFRLSSTEVLL